MKKIFKGIGDSLGMLLIIFLIVGMFEPKRPKRFKWKYVLIFIALFFLGWQISDTYRNYQNEVPDHGCMPATLHRVFPNHSVRELVKLCKTTDVGTPLENIFPAWKALSTNELVIEYSALEQYQCKNETLLRFGVPYLWVGIWDSGHIALVSFETNKVTFSHSQFYDGTTNYVVVDMDWPTFFAKTYVVFSSPELTNKPIRLR